MAVRPGRDFVKGKLGEAHGCACRFMNVQTENEKMRLRVRVLFPITRLRHEWSIARQGLVGKWHDVEVVLG